MDYAVYSSFGGNVTDVVIGDRKTPLPCLAGGLAVSWELTEKKTRCSWKCSFPRIVKLLFSFNFENLIEQSALLFNIC